MITADSLAALEFPKLLSLVAGLTHSDASREAVLALTPLLRRDAILRRLGEVEEVRRMSQDGHPLSIASFPDILLMIQKARPEGSVLDPVELARIREFLDCSTDVFAQIMADESLALLKEIADTMRDHPGILKALRKSVDSEGNILDTASPALYEIRTRIKALERRVRKRLEEMIHDSRVSLFLQSDFITQRSGRWVIPVRMDSKGQVPGVVHDVSKSGETAFVEPLAIISLANERDGLMAEEKAEELRILRDLSARIRFEADSIETDFHAVVYLDLLLSIARFSDSLRMEIPEINEEGRINLVGARHPLLLQSYEGRAVVPLDVRLGVDKTVMVITGANAGGKTIAIKSIGLLVTMALSGMPIPADSSSTIPLIHHLLVDIGDKQSIEDSLSTFSAHVSNISSIVDQADRRTLILMDELGTGTDPEEGAAIACAVLKDLRESRALVFATTHLMDIKGYVHTTEGMVNASMEFDEEKLIPLYRLRVGEIGRSYALETAHRYGLPAHIVASAREILGTKKVDMEALITELHEKRRFYEDATRDIDRRQRELEERERLLKERSSEVETRQKESLAKAYKEASDIVTLTRRMMNSLLHEMKEKGKEKGKEILKETEAVLKEVTEKRAEYEPRLKGISIDEVKEGDQVFVRSMDSNAQVLKVNRKEKRLRVRSGNKEVELPVTEVGPAKGLKKEPEPQVRIEREEETTQSRINLLGKRVDEAIMEIEPFLNHASLAGVAEVVIIHGIGTGALSRGIKEYLKGHPLVKDFRSGERQEGGAGVTVVGLR
ncbi:MAG: endonuclease MutS2 [Thermodesulfovibrionales bacterium]|jgi:DNA mismatch repair protein MutS2